MNSIRNITRGCEFSQNKNGESIGTAILGGNKMEVFDWLENIGNSLAVCNIVEVQFKNTRKSYYISTSLVELKKGDVVVVESSPGIDIGIISLTGDLVAKQIKKTRFQPDGDEYKKVIRKAGPNDINKWQEAIALEYNTMIRSRQIASDLELKMKIGDVEYQGDRLKAIFYYIADDRVDFRELIKILAEQFRIRVEMKQIGSRQEAGRIGGISACGRELCCSTWLNSFQSVTIGAARHQEMSLNPQKLAGQCGKLKCCLNYEVDNYIDARREFPRVTAPLEALDGTYHLVKVDIFHKTMYFSPDQYSSSIMIPVGIEKVRKIMAMNKMGEKIDRIEDDTLIKPIVDEPTYSNVVGVESITRFDKSKSAGRNSERGSDRNSEKNSDRNRNNRNRNNKDGDAAAANSIPGERRAEGGEKRPENGRETGRNRNNRNNRPNEASQDKESPTVASSPGEQRTEDGEKRSEKVRDNNRNRNNRNSRSNETAQDKDASTVTSNTGESHTDGTEKRSENGRDNNRNRNNRNKRDENRRSSSGIPSAESGQVSGTTDNGSRELTKNESVQGDQNKAESQPRTPRNGRNRSPRNERQSTDRAAEQRTDRTAEQRTDRTPEPRADRSENQGSKGNSADAKVPRGNREGRTRYNNRTPKPQQ